MVLVWQMTNSGVLVSCAWEPAYVTMLMRCNGGNPACWHMVLRWLLLMIFICVVVIQWVVYLMLGQRVTCSWLCHIFCLNYGIWNGTQQQNTASHSGAEDSNQSRVIRVKNPSRGQRCDITSTQLIFCSFILQRSFVVKKLGNTKIDSWIVMPIMTI